MKKLIVGLVVGLLFGLSANAFASVGDKVQAIFAQFNYIVDGSAKTLDAPILVYEGTSYVRTTQIANLLGYDVTYKADSRTIEFNNPKPVSTPTPSAEPVSASTPNQTPAPTASPVTITTPAPTSNPTPPPDNTAVCNSIRSNFASLISQTNESYNSRGMFDSGARIAEVNALQSQMSS